MALDRQPTLVSELLVVRPLRRFDFDALWAISSDPLLWEQHPAKERAELAGFEGWFDDAIGSRGALVVLSSDDDEVIGTSRYDRLDEDANEVEIGWTFIARRLWGGQHNGELKRLMLEHAFRSVDVVVFRVHSENMRSRRAVEKLGAVLVATEVDALGRGENVVYRLSAEQWGEATQLG
ncbi:MAG: GNAT family N-acetyltransferase [Acidimicrobiales bacterium]